MFFHRTFVRIFIICPGRAHPQQQLIRSFIHSQDSVVSVVTKLRAEWSRVQILAGTGDFSLLQNVHITSRAHQASYSMGALYWGIKWPGCEADHSPLSSAKVKNYWSYTYTLPVRPCGVCRSNFILLNGSLVRLPLSNWTLNDNYCMDTASFSRSHKMCLDKSCIVFPDMYYHTAPVHDIVIRWHNVTHTSHIHVCVMFVLLAVGNWRELYP